MPTIDELAPAPAATDSDELPVSQNLITRKITRAQILSGVQQQLVLPAGSVLGRTSAGLGFPETIAVGNYLSLASGTLSALAAPYSIALSPGGLVPAGTDLVPVGQDGQNVSVSYNTFLQGLGTISGIDGTQLMVTPSGGTVGLTLGTLAASAITTGGGSLVGPLNLAANPSGPLQAATKQYVDLKINRAGDTLTGPLQLTADPTMSLQAATKNYVDANSGVPKAGFTMSGPIVLAGDPTTALNPATKSYTDARILRSGDNMTGPLGLAANPVSATQAATKSYVDTQVATGLSLTGGTLSGPLTLSADPTVALQAATKQYSDAKVARAGDTMLGLLTLAGSPTTTLHAAPKGYIDTQVATLLPRAGGTMAGALFLSGDPTTPSQASTKYYVDTAIAGTLPSSGGTVTGPISLTATPALPPHVTTKQYVDTQVVGLLPLTGGSLSGLLTLGSAPSAPMHAVTKQYVDANPGPDGVVNVRLSPCNAALNGKADDTAAFATAYQLAPAGGTIYVPNGSTTIKDASGWGVTTTKRVKWIVDGTTLPDGSVLGDAIPSGSSAAAITLPATVTGLGATGAVFSQAASQPTDFAVLHASYVVTHTGGTSQVVIANARTDTIINQGPLNNVWSGYDRLVWSATQTPSASAPSRHVGRYVQTIRQSVGTDGTGAPLPQPLMWSSFTEFRDTTGKPSSWTNASVASEVDWFGNGADD